MTILVEFIKLKVATKENIHKKEASYVTESIITLLLLCYGIKKFIC